MLTIGQINSVSFTVDDIYISHIFSIASAFGFKLSIDIKPKED